MASHCCVRSAAVTKVADSLEGDEATGARLVASSLVGPIKQIAENAGVNGGVVIAKVLEMSGNEGYNAATDTYEDLVKIGVIDAAKVTRSALQNAASIAALFLTTEVVIVDKPEAVPPCPWAAATWTSDAGRPTRLAVAANRSDSSCCPTRSISTPVVSLANSVGQLLLSDAVDYLSGV